jgi:hypothetical protein
MDNEIRRIPYRNEIIKAESDQGEELAAKAYIILHIPALQTENISLKLTYERESPIGSHYDFIETFRGIEVYGTEIKVNIAKNKKVMSCFEKTIAIHDFEAEFTDILDSNKSASVLGPQITINGSKEVIFISGNTNPIKGWKVDYSILSKPGSFTAILDDQYNILYRKDNSMYYSSHDSVVKAMVFLPDPLSTANMAKGVSPYLNYNDSAVPAIDSQRKAVTMIAQYQKNSLSGKDSFYLESPYMKYVDASAPYTGYTYSNIPVFDFNRDKPAFEDVMIFYHLNVHQQHIRKLGFTNLCNYQLQVDGHGLTIDNSQFSGSSLQKNNILLFGVGGIPDAQDADVIIHEYSHAIQWSASPNSNYGEDRIAAEEGYCDYFACSYSKMLTTNQWRKIYNWDGDGEFWPGRSCASSKVYPKDLVHKIHDDCEIFTSPLMAIYDDIGRDTTDLLMLTTMYSLTSNLSMPAIARLFLETDSTLYNGRHANSIITHFVEHGLLDSNIYQGIERREFAKSVIISKYFSKEGILDIHFDRMQSGMVSLYSLDGKELLNLNFLNQSNLTLYRPELKSGLYILHISTPHLQEAFKLLKN